MSSSSTTALQDFVKFGEKYTTKQPILRDRDMNIGLRCIGPLRATGKVAALEIT